MHSLRVERMREQAGSRRKEPDVCRYDVGLVMGFFFGAGSMVLVISSKPACFNRDWLLAINDNTTLFASRNHTCYLIQ